VDSNHKYEAVLRHFPRHTAEVYYNEFVKKVDMQLLPKEDGLPPIMLGFEAGYSDLDEY
jgi:hypothetical protein